MSNMKGQVLLYFCILQLSFLLLFQYSPNSPLSFSPSELSLRYPSSAVPTVIFGYNPSVQCDCIDRPSRLGPLHLPKFGGILRSNTFEDHTEREISSELLLPVRMRIAASGPYTFESKQIQVILLFRHRPSSQKQIRI